MLRFGGEGGSRGFDPEAPQPERDRGSFEEDAERLPTSPAEQEVEELHHEKPEGSEEARREEKGVHSGKASQGGVSGEASRKTAEERGEAAQESSTGTPEEIGWMEGWMEARRKHFEGLQLERVSEKYRDIKERLSALDPEIQREALKAIRLRMLLLRRIPISNKAKLRLAEALLDRIGEVL